MLQYWPGAEMSDAKGVLILPPFTIKARSIRTDDPDVVFTDLLLQCGDEMRTCEHHHWTTWPDKSVPKNAAVAFRLLAHPRDYTHHPTVVHCSAGVGRTGTLVLLEYIIQ